jgi:hypothetical protein
MLNYLVHVTAPVTTFFNADNLRGEPRWERNVADALISEKRNIHTVWDIWKSQEPKPENLHSGIVNEWLDNSLMITYGVPQRTHIYDVKAKYNMVHYLDGPDDKTKTEFFSHKNIVATCNFKSWEYFKRLVATLGQENVEWIGGPAVPYVIENTDNFNQKYLLWSYRNFIPYATNEPLRMQILLSKIRDYLKSDSKLELVILAHAIHQEQQLAMNSSMKDWFFSYSFTKELKEFQDRIHIKTNLNWHQMIDIFKQTKLIISPPEPLGGPPFEAAMFGIPTLVCKDNNPFQESNGTPFFPELLKVNPKTIGNDFLQSLDKLFYDKTFFTKHGNSYRQWVKNNATYAAYVRQVDEITSKRGWK